MLLLESEPIKVELIEEREGRMFMRGEFGRADVPTQNKRVYGRKLWEREIGRLGESLKRKRVYGELDHPGDGRTLLQRVSHIITDLKLSPDGRVIGEALIMNTPNGKTLQAILKDGGEVGISSRATGSTTQREDGNEEVQEDFLLKSFDFVADPAMRTAYPKMRTESDDVAALLSEGVEPEIDGLLESEIEARVQQRLQEKQAEARKAVEAEVDEARDAMRRELASDPEIAGAKTVLAQIGEMLKPYTEPSDVTALRDALEAKEDEMAKVREDAEKAARLARKAGYLLYVEQRIAAHPFAGTIRSLFSDVERMESLDDVKGRMDQILSDFSGLVPEKEEPDHVHEDVELRSELEEVKSALSELRSEHAALVAEHSALTAERSKLLESQKATKEKLSRAAEIGRQLGDKLEEADRRREEAERRAEQAQEQAKRSQVESMKVKRTSGFANRHKLDRLLESAETEEEVDSVVREHGTARVADPMLEAMRQRIQKGRPNVAAQSRRELSEGSGGGVLFGHDVRELQELAGIDD